MGAGGNPITKGLFLKMNGFDLAIFALFTFSVIFIGLPLSVYLIKKGVDGFRRYGFNKLPQGFLLEQGLGKYSIEILFYGIFLFSFSIWYLFMDKGGQLSRLMKYF